MATKNDRTNEQSEHSMTPRRSKTRWKTNGDHEHSKLTFYDFDKTMHYSESKCIFRRRNAFIIRNRNAPKFTYCKLWSNFTDLFCIQQINYEGKLGKSAIIASPTKWKLNSTHLCRKISLREKTICSEWKDSARQKCNKFL